MTASSVTTGVQRRSGPREFASAVATIMVKELRSRMRGRRAFIVLTLYLAVLALITYGVYVVVAPVARAAGGGLGLGQANASAFIGQSIFAVLSIFQLILVSMIAPAFTAGQISLEREKQTLDLLMTTPLRPGAIIIGKLLTALAFVVLMIVAAIPICAIVLMYGGASVDDIVRQQVVLLAVAVGFGAVGIFASALMQRTQAATVVTYCTVLALTLGTAMVFTFWNELATSNENGFAIAQPNAAPEQLRYLNPMVGMLDVVSGVEASGPTRFTRPLYELFGQDLANIAGGDVTCDGVGCAEPGLGGGFGDLGPRPLPGGEVANPIGSSGYWWPRVAISFVLVAAVLTLLSMRLVLPAPMRWTFLRPARRSRRTDDGAPPLVIQELHEEPDR
ncbi:MAG TPA: ABC transporter permease subunit [Candidatus Limnocylindrales bacterium]|nr:ABC transporter permease subunit [Candidatus Limnocylindrales bacterium]